MLTELQVGLVRRTHGVHGEVKVYTTSEDPERFESLRKVRVKGRKCDRELTISGVRYFKDLTILKFEEINDPEEAASLAGAEILIPRSEALPLAEGEYFIGDLIGCLVYLEDGSYFGKLTDVLQTGANDVYEVLTEDGREVLLPVIPECVLEKHPEDLRIVIRLMKGLI